MTKYETLHFVHFKNKSPFFSILSTYIIISNTFLLCICSGGGFKLIVRRTYLERASVDQGPPSRHWWNRWDETFPEFSLIFIVNFSIYWIFLKLKRVFTGIEELNIISITFLRIDLVITSRLLIKHL